MVTLSLNDAHDGIPPGIAEAISKWERRESDRREGSQYHVASPDNGSFSVKRWVLVLLLSALSAAGGFIWQASRHDTLAEARMAAIERRVESIEKLVELYETLRMQRERQIAELQTQQANTSRTIDQMRTEINNKLDRVLFGQVRSR